MARRQARGWAAQGAASRRSRHEGRAEPVEVDVESLGAGGAGLARVDGRVVWVRGAAPGDRLSILDPGVASRGAVARILRVISPGPDRVEPPCPAVRRCGGCDWMHLDVAAQRREHARIAAASIAHALGVEVAALPPVVAHEAPASLGYRTRARLFVRADRHGVAVGYRAAGSSELVALDACAVLSPILVPVLAELRGALAGAGGEGDANVALGRSGDDVRPVVDLAWDGEVPPSVYAAFDALVAERRWAGARVRLAGASQPASFGDPSAVLVAPDGAPLTTPPGGFAQASDDGAALLARRVAALARTEGAHVLELYAGSGLLSVLLARGAASFTGVELDEAAVRAARRAFEARSLAGKHVAADAATHAIPAKVDLVVLDPPRTGARDACVAIAKARPRRVVYVSCDVATLARDLAILCGKRGQDGGSHVIEAIETFEMFPQTSHVETVVALRRARPAKPKEGP